MKIAISLAAGLLVAFATSGPGRAQAATPMDLVNAAVTAEGGAAALRGIHRLQATTEVKHWEPEQSMVAGGPPRLLGTSTVTLRWDVDQNVARSDWDHVMLYPFPGKEKYSDIIAPAYGAVVDDKGGQRAMSGNRLALLLREYERSSPLLLLHAQNAPQSVAAAPDQKLGGKTYPAVAFTENGTAYTILFDRKTHLPAAVRTFEDDDIHGDGTFDLILSDWQALAGVKIAHALDWRFNGLEKLQIAVKDETLNPSLAADAFTVRDDVRQQAKPPASGDVAWQTILARYNFGRFNDLQADKDDAEGLGMKMVELSPNIQQVMGRTHNSLVVAMPHYLVVFDAPISDAYARWAIDAAKAKYPGKPIKYLVLTHHHMDHMSGARTYVAEGATVIVGKADKAHVLALFRTAHKMHPDALQKNPKPAAVTEVADRMTIKDGASEIHIARFENPHVVGMLMMQVMPENLVWVTDVYSAGRDKTMTPGIQSVVDAEKKFGMTPARYATGHGSAGTEAELDAIVAAK